MNTKTIAMLVPLLLSVACVEKGSSGETKTVADLSSYKTCAIEFDESGMTNGAKHKPLVIAEVRSSLANHHVCEAKDEGADLTLKIKGKLDEVKEFGMGGAGLAGKDFEAVFDVELYDTKAQKTVGAFTAKGNTKEDTGIKMGGVDARTMAGDKDQTALKRAADQVGTFMATKRKG